MLSDNAFQIDDHQDQSLASDRKSRYGAYLRDKRRLFFHNGPDSPPTADPVEFAVAAWSVATPPIMSPGYVSSHPRSRRPRSIGTTTTVLRSRSRSPSRRRRSPTACRRGGPGGSRTAGALAGATPTTTTISPCSAR